MMHAAPTAPSAPAMVAVMSPFELNADRLRWALRPATGMMTPIRKYATPTQSNAFSGFCSCAVPRPRNAPYAPHDRTAPATKTTHAIDRGRAAWAAAVDVACETAAVEGLMCGASYPKA